MRGHVEADPKSPLLVLHHLKLLPKDARVVPPLQVRAVQEDHPVQIGEGLVVVVVVVVVVWGVRGVTCG